MSKSPLNTLNDQVLMSIMATKPVHAPRNKKAAGTQAEPVSAEALHASANVFQNTMAMLLARNMPAVVSQQPTPPPVEAAPTPATASRQPRDRRLFADHKKSPELLYVGESTPFRGILPRKNVTDYSILPIYKNT